MSLRDIKNSVIKELDWKLKNEILEQTNYDLLVKLINRAEDEKEVSAIFQLGTQYYKTGLKYDVRLEKTSPDIHYLKKNEEKSFETDPNALTHKLIIGDNYHALLNLLISHRGLIDVIYIDPPYGCDSMGQFADTNYDNHITRDNLLSMLHTRLILAKQLLSETGVIFCSIDDKNQAYIKCLFDNVFGEENFICNFPRLTTKSGKTPLNFMISNDYVLCYVKSRKDIFNGDIFEDDSYKFSDEFENERGKYNLKQPLDVNSLRYSKSLDYPIIIGDNTFYPGSVTEEEYKFKQINGTNDNYAWRWSKELFDFGYKNGFIVIKETPNGKRIYTKNYLKATIEKTNNNEYKIIYREKTRKKSTIDFISNEYSNDIAKKQIDNLLSLNFDYPKPVNLIKELIKCSSNQDSIVLDFFAGSGTTGQAVLDLNREDGGNRKFILCTNNDKDEININGIAYDVTCERLKRVMTGKDYNEENNFKWAEKNEPYGDNLLVCECKTINNFTQTPGNNAFEKIDETLYDQKKMNDPDKIKWVCENFNLTCKYIEGEE